MSDRRWIVVGHADKGIEYTGNWTTNDGTKYDTQGNFGATYKGLHGATGIANFSYVFNGAQGRIMGTNNIKNSSGVLDPVWECFIDGVSIGLGNATIFPYIENNWQLCNWYTLTPGQHTITVNVNSQSQAFFFDRFEYLPSGQVDGAGILVNELDPDLLYDSSWQNLGTISQMTQKTGATVFFPFVGTGLSWYGTTPTELSHQETTATYSVDNGTPVTFSVPGLQKADSSTQYNRKLFEIPSLSAGSHNLTITLTQGGNVSPLTLNYLMIEGGSTAYLGTVSSASSGAATSTSTSVNSPGHSKSTTPVGAIVGGVLGAIALVLLSVLGILWYRRRRQQGPAVVFQTHEVQPFVVSEDQHPNPSSPTQQSSFVTSTSKNASPSAATRDYHPPGAVGKQAMARQTLAPTLASNPHQIPSTATTANSASETSGFAGDSSSRVVIHQDSGIRLPQQGPDLMEYPPIYTPG